MGATVTLPTLREVVASALAGRSISLPVLVAVNADAEVAARNEAWTGVTGVPSAPLAWTEEELQHLFDNACLVVDDLSRGGRGLRLTVGRSRRCDYRIADVSVSALHAHLVYDLGSGEYTIADAGSRNGTYVNGSRVPPQIRTAIWAGALLGFGQVVFCFLDPPMVRKLATFDRR